MTFSILQKIKENGKKSKNNILWGVVMLHDLVVSKIKKLEFLHILQKTWIRKIKKPNFGTSKMENALFALTVKV
jgi:hypothetical protein